MKNEWEYVIDVNNSDTNDSTITMYKYVKDIL